MIFVIKGNHRLCQDGRWREHANFGTFSSCVKVYKRRGPAVRIAKSQKALLAEVPVGYTVNAAGQVNDASGDMAGTLANFTVPLDYGSA